MASAWGDSWGSSWGDSWGAVAGAVAATPTIDSGAGSGKAKRTDFWWELSTISFLARVARRNRKRVSEKPQDLPAVAAIISQEIEETEDDFDEIRSFIFQANAEIASLEAARRKDEADSARIDRQIDRIKAALVRLREEDDILTIALID